jgi:hypothetical protein
MPAAGGRSPAGEPDRAGGLRDSGHDEASANSANSANVSSYSLDGCGQGDLFTRQIGQQTNTEMLGLFSNRPSHKYELKTLSLTNQRLTLFSIGQC